MRTRRPSKGALLAAALVLVSCGQPTSDSGGAGPLPPLSPTTTAKASAPAGTPGTQPGAPGQVPTTARPSTGGTRPTTPPPSASAVSPASAAGPPGSFARTILRPAPAERLVLDVLVQDGGAPKEATLTAMTNQLGRASGKPVAISRSPLPIESTSHSDNDIRGYGTKYGRVAQEGDRAVLRVLFLAGGYAGSSSVLGVAVRGDTLAVFPQAVARARSPLVSAETLEEAVAVHELGHLLGLVDLARDTGRADPAHPGHSPNRASVMFWAIDTDVVSQVLDGPPPTNFDAADQADLAALRNGA